MKNDPYQSLLTRRSIRSYTDKPVEDALIDQLIEAGQYAPSAMNRQPTAILAVTDKELRDLLSDLNQKVMKQKNPAYNADPFYNAPAVLAVFADPSVPTYVYDGSLVMGNILNAAHALGLSSCWINRCREVFEMPQGKAILKEYGIPENYEGIGFAIAGYSDQPSVEPKERTSIVRKAK